VVSCIAPFTQVFPECLAGLMIPSARTCTLVEITTYRGIHAPWTVQNVLHSGLTINIISP
jgi:hypothetical protein